MLTFDRATQLEFEKILDNEIEQAMIKIVAPYAIQDFAAYKYQVGFIAGLKEAAQLLLQAQDNVREKERAK